MCNGNKNTPADHIDPDIAIGNMHLLVDQAGKKLQSGSHHHFFSDKIENMNMVVEISICYQPVISSNRKPNHIEFNGYPKDI